MSFLPPSLLRVLRDEFCPASSPVSLVKNFLSTETYSREFTCRLLEQAKDSKGGDWVVRQLAVLILEHQVLKIAPSDLSEWTHVLGNLGLIQQDTNPAEVDSVVLNQGFTSIRLQEFVAQLARRLARHAAIHASISGRETSPYALRNFIRLSRQDCKLYLGRYCFEPEEVVNQILGQVRVSAGSVSPYFAKWPETVAEAERTASALPHYEASILTEMVKRRAIYWASEETSEDLNSLVEYPLTTVALN